jgi:hypothetical protein
MVRRARSFGLQISEPFVSFVIFVVKEIRVIVLGCPHRSLKIHERRRLAVQLIHTIYEPEGAGPHPALLTLHGRGANAFDLLGLAPHLCGGKFLMICPQGPLEMPIGPDAVGYAWFPMSMGGPPDLAAILSSQKLLLAFLDQCLQRYSIDAKKLVVLGFSQGGLMTHLPILSVLLRWRPSAVGCPKSWCKSSRSAKRSARYPRWCSMGLKIR